VISKRTLLASMGALVCVPGAKPARAKLPPISMERHERSMRAAIEQGRRNAAYPFGAVIVEAQTGEVMGEGVNDMSANPTLHGEIACMNDYVGRHGSRDWPSRVLYTTAEPCPMCMGALIWARIGGVVFGTSIETLKRSGIDQIDIAARAVVDAAPFYAGTLLGGVLQDDTDRLFRARKRD
jgi:tRNA(adenine34) deaminase